MSRSTRKPWVNSCYGWRQRPRIKRAQNRRYRKLVRSDLKQWRNRYFYSIFRDCNTWKCFEEECSIECKVCLAYELEPSYPHPHLFNQKCDIIEFRHYCDRPEYRRK